MFGSCFNRLIKTDRSFNKKFRAFLLFVFIILLISSMPLYAWVYYVDINNEQADDSNDGLNEEAPWRTIHKANQILTAGDTVIVKAGVYHDWICPQNNGTPSAWIVYKSELQYGAILDGWVPLDSVIAEGSAWEKASQDTSNIWRIQLISNVFTEAWMDSVRMPFPYPYPCDTLEFAPGRSFVDSTGMLYVWIKENKRPDDDIRWTVTLKNGVWILPINSQKRFVVVEGFVAQNYGVGGITVEANYVKILNNIAHRNGRSGIAVAFCDFVSVEGNEAYHNGTGIGFSQGITAYSLIGRHVSFRRNISHDNYDGADPEHCGTDGSGFILDTCQPQAGAEFINNLAYNNAGAGFGVFQSCNARFINNTSVNNNLKSDCWADEFHLIGTGEGPSDSILVRNNIFVSKKTDSPLFSVTYSAKYFPRDIRFDHNLFYEPAGDDSTNLFEVTFHSAIGDKHWVLNFPQFQNFSFDYDTIHFEPHWGTGSMVAKPVFYDWTDLKFNLDFGSPAIDAGCNDLAPEDDLAGNGRPYGDGVDMGAFEYTGETRLGDAPQKPVSYFNVFPNPFNNCVQIKYRLKQPTKIDLAIYDILGRLVIKMKENLQLPGTHQFTWQGKNSAGRLVTTGIYFIRLQAKNIQYTRKILLVK